MQFTTFVAATALASVAAANMVHFVNQDEIERTIKFTAQVPLEQIPSIVVPGYGTGNVSFPDSWIGNWYSISKGEADVPGMLGEVRFNGFAGATYFDVSAIVNPNDVNGVKMLMPKNSPTPVSGCQTFPCSNAYNQPDDIATLSTDESELICLLGNLKTQQRRNLGRHSHEFIHKA